MKQSFLTETEIEKIKNLLSIERDLTEKHNIEQQLGCYEAFLNDNEVQTSLLKLKNYLKNHTYIRRFFRI